MFVKTEKQANVVVAVVVKRAKMRCPGRVILFIFLTLIFPVMFTVAENIDKLGKTTGKPAEVAMRQSVIAGSSAPSCIAMSTSKSAAKRYEDCKGESLKTGVVIVTGWQCSFAACKPGFFTGVCPLLSGLTDVLALLKARVHWKKPQVRQIPQQSLLPCTGFLTSMALWRPCCFGTASRVVLLLMPVQAEMDVHVSCLATLDEILTA